VGIVRLRTKATEFSFSISRENHKLLANQIIFVTTSGNTEHRLIVQLVCRADQLKTSWREKGAGGVAGSGRLINSVRMGLPAQVMG
jgi:hypothetical protein